MFCTYWDINVGICVRVWEDISYCEYDSDAGSFIFVQKPIRFNQIPNNGQQWICNFPFSIQEKDFRGSKIRKEKAKKK